MLTVIHLLQNTEQTDALTLPFENTRNSSSKWYFAAAYFNGFIQLCIKWIRIIRTFAFIRTRFKWYTCVVMKWLIRSGQAGIISGWILPEFSIYSECNRFNHCLYFGHWEVWIADGVRGEVFWETIPLFFLTKNLILKALSLTLSFRYLCAINVLRK